MTLNPVKSNDTSTSTAATPQEHHMKAAEHLEQAAKCHKEAAQLIGTSDHKGAQTHVQTAHEHAAKAQEHIDQACKKTAPMTK